jgi:MFS family permease
MAPAPPHEDAERFRWESVRQGLRFLKGRRVLQSTFTFDLNAMIFGMPTSLFPVLALDVFGTGPAGLGLMAAAPAAGAFVAAIFSGWLKAVQRTGRAILFAVAAWGLAITGFGLVTVSFPAALLFLAVAGAADLFSAIFRSSLVQLDTPDNLRGRVMSIHILVVTSGPRLGDIEAAVVAALTNPQFAVVSGGVACVLGVAVVARRFPQLASYMARTTVRSGV